MAGKRRTEMPIANAEDEPPVMGYHPLFARAEGDPEAGKPRDYGWIVVRRKEAEGWATVPGFLNASALTDYAQIQAEWGGGAYELIAYPPNKKGFVDRVQFVLPGIPRPLAPQAAKEEAPEAPQAQAMPGPQDPMAMVFGAMMQMMQLQQSQQAAMLQAQVQAQAEQTKLLVAVLTQPRDNGPSPMVEVLKGMQAQQTELLRVATQERDSSSALAAYRAGAKEAWERVPSDDGDDPTEMLGKIAEAAGTVISAMAQGGQGAPPQN